MHDIWGWMILRYCNSTWSQCFQECDHYGYRIRCYARSPTIAGIKTNRFGQYNRPKNINIELVFYSQDILTVTFIIKSFQIHNKCKNNLIPMELNTRNGDIPLVTVACNSAQEMAPRGNNSRRQYIYYITKNLWYFKRSCTSKEIVHLKAVG